MARTRPTHPESSLTSPSREPRSHDGSHAGAVVSGTIANPGDQATYTFTGTAGQTLYFSALDSAAGSEAELIAQGGNAIFNTSYSNQGPFTLTVSGTYTLDLSNENGATGDF